MSLNKPKPWEEVRDTVAGAESFDDDYGTSYDRIAYDVKNKGNAAGIKPPKPISQMTIGELNDWQETQMRSLSRDYGFKKFGQDDPRGKYGSTGAGKYQFEKSTLIDTAKDLYGNEYTKVQYTPEVQEKLAQHLYNKRAAQGPESLGNTWHVLRNEPARDPMIVAGTAATGIAAKSLFNKDQQDQAELQRAAQMAAEREAGIGTLKQYTSRPAGEYMGLLNKSRNQRKREMMAAIEQRRRNKKQVAEEMSFKNLRKKIQEQIIMNEENQE